MPTTYIYCEGDPSAAALLDGLRAGHAFVTESPDGPEIRLHAGEAMMGDRLQSPGPAVGFSVSTRRAAGMTLEVCGAQGPLYRQDLSEAETEHSIMVPVRDTLYVRAQLISEDDGLRQVHALTNPIYLIH